MISLSSKIRIIMIQLIELLNLFSTSMNWLGEHEPRSRITRRESLSTSIRVDREEIGFVIKEITEIDSDIGGLCGEGISDIGKKIIAGIISIIKED